MPAWEYKINMRALFQPLKGVIFSAWVVLFFAAVNGLIYVFLVPPWEHNDEPGNFEYAWMFANMPGSREEWVWKNDQQLRRQVAASMIEQGFFEHHPVGKPNLILLDQEIWIGLKQTPGLPFHFWLTSLPLRFLSYIDVVIQLYAARLVSWALFVFTVYLSLRVNRELNWETKVGLQLPFLFALFPSFVDKMTAVNDDVGAVAFFTLFLWACVSIWKNGLSIWRVGVLITAIALCVVTKRNVWVSVPLGAIVFLWVLLSRWRRLRWVLLGFVFVSLAWVLISFERQIPAFYYTFANHQLASTKHSEMSVAGKGVVALSPGYRMMYQPIAGQKLDSLTSQTVEFGYWVWGEGELSSSPARVWVNGEVVSSDQPLSLSSEPTLVSQTLRLPAQLKKVAVEVSVVVPEGAEAYLDCLYLVVGQSLSPPQPKDASCSKMQVNGREVENYLRNGSFEQRWLRLQPWLESWVDERFNFSITHLWAVTDVNVGLPYLRASGGHVFETFWGRFGWGAVALKGQYAYTGLALFTVLLFVGNGLAMFQNRRTLAWDGVIFMALSFGLILVMTLFRNGGNWIWYEATPNARYLMPAFLPMGMFLVNGWNTLSQFVLRDSEKKHFLINWLWLGLLIVYNLWSMVSIWSFYINIRSLS